MARDWVINGECLVTVKGAGALASGQISIITGSGLANPPYELGLAQDSITISPRFVHVDIKSSDFGPEIVPERMWMLADAKISINLVHYDKIVLAACVSESMGGWDGGLTGGLGFPDPDGIFVGAGTTMGGNAALFTSGNHYISLNFTSQQLKYPWRFPTCYMTDTPVEIPLGTERSIVKTNWKAVPFALHTLSSGPSMTDPVTYEVFSSGVKLWDHVLDT
jgi:hypothetical protein